MGSILIMTHLSEQKTNPKNKLSAIVFNAHHLKFETFKECFVVFFYRQSTKKIIIKIKKSRKWMLDLKFYVFLKKALFLNNL